LKRLKKDPFSTKNPVKFRHPPEIGGSLLSTPPQGSLACKGRLWLCNIHEFPLRGPGGVKDQRTLKWMPLTLGQTLNSNIVIEDISFKRFSFSSELLVF
jgi:hypothetical protein